MGLRQQLTPEESATALRQLRKTVSGLRETANEFFNKVVNRDVRGMFLYPKNRLKEAWALTDVYERTLAAQELGWTVVIRADQDGLHVDYAKKLPTSRPWNF